MASFGSSTFGTVFGQSTNSSNVGSFSFGSPEPSFSSFANKSPFVSGIGIGTLNNLLDLGGTLKPSYCPTTVDNEPSPLRPSYPVELQSISAMRVYSDKSHEELRYEDYEFNNKGPPLNSVFRKPSPSTNPTPVQPITPLLFPTARVSTTPLFQWPTSDPAPHAVNGQQNVFSNTDSVQPTEVANPSPFFSKENPSVQRSLHIMSKAQVGNSSSPFKPCFRVNVGSIDVDDVSSLMPKLPPGKEYYTEPSIEELEAKERAEPGFCSHVKDFVVGRKDKGSIKFLGETDIRGLDVESIVQLNDLEVVVYFDNSKKPPVGQGLNKPAEVTLLNVKCVSKLTGNQYMDGPQLRRYEEKWMEKAQEVGAEFTSYDPVQGVWKFRVQHF